MLGLRYQQGGKMKTVHDSIAKPKAKARNGWNTKGYKETRGEKLKGSYYQRATAVKVTWAPTT